ncbi:hypothetical protein [Marinilactibacillus psychrotolerans]|nr:hypothetical protein [Marinilactibacillus psychrotolerans]
MRSMYSLRTLPVNHYIQTARAIVRSAWEADVSYEILFFLSGLAGAFSFL